MALSFVEVIEVDVGVVGGVEAKGQVRRSMHQCSSRPQYPQKSTCYITVRELGLRSHV